MDQTLVLVSIDDFLDYGWEYEDFTDLLAGRISDARAADINDGVDILISGFAFYKIVNDAEVLLLVNYEVEN